MEPLPYQFTPSYGTTRRAWDCVCRRWGSIRRGLGRFPVFSLVHRETASNSELLSSILLDEETFYPRFTKDFQGALHEVIIESPFLTSRRLSELLPRLADTERP